MTDVESCSQHRLRSASPQTSGPRAVTLGTCPHSPQGARERLLAPLPQPRSCALPWLGATASPRTRKSWAGEGAQDQVGVWGNKCVALEKQQWTESLHYSHTCMWLLFGKITGKTKVWYPNMSVFIQEDICGLKRKRRWSLRAPRMPQGLWELLQL